MRELANFSAQTAIDKHSRKKLTRTVTSKLIVSLVGLLVAVCLICLWWTNTPGRPALYAAGVSLVVALLWGLQSFLLRRRMKGGQSTKRDRDVTDDAAPPHSAPETEPYSLRDLLVNGDGTSALDGLPAADAPPVPNGE